MAAINFKTLIIIEACDVAKRMMNDTPGLGGGEAVRLAIAAQAQMKQAWPTILKLHDAAVIAAATSVDGAILLTLDEVAPIIGPLKVIAREAA